MANVPVYPHEMRLLGAWAFRTAGSPVHVQVREQRLLALLGLRGPQSRASAAGALWPDSTEDRARANLRTSLVRIRRGLGDVVVARRDEVGLDDSVVVDVHALRGTLDDAEADPQEVATRGAHALRSLRMPELLVGWYDDWVLFDRERLQHRTIRALEELARVSLDGGRSDEAAIFAEEAVALEPLLDSAVTLQVRALLRSGNLSAALQAYRTFRARLQSELRVAPPEQLTALMRSAMAERSLAARP